jgi:HK97 family phage major capsid protein
LRVIVTPAATAGEPLVGDFSRGAKLYRKGGVSVEATNSDGTDFIKNLVTIRAEVRVLLGKTYPEAFRTAAISGAS